MTAPEPIPPRCRATTFVRSDEHDTGKARTCELAQGHAGEHATTYCGKAHRWHGERLTPERAGARRPRPLEAAVSANANESDALLIARWCWPKCDWTDGAWEAGDGRDVFKDEAWRRRTYVGDHGLENEVEVFGTRDQHASIVHAAERVLIERGHAEAYGKALWREIYPRGDPRVGEFAAGLLIPFDVAFHATIVLDVRVRAMAAAIRALDNLVTE